MEKAIKQVIQLMEVLGLLPEEEYNECSEVAGQVKLLCKGLNAGCMHLQNCLHACLEQVMAVSDYIAGCLSLTLSYPFKRQSKASGETKVLREKEWINW